MEGEAAGGNGESSNESLVLPADFQDLDTAGRGCCKVLQGAARIVLGWERNETDTAQSWERQGAALYPPGTSSLGSSRGKEQKGKEHERKNSKNGTGSFASKKQQGSILEGSV